MKQKIVSLRMERIAFHPVMLVLALLGFISLVFWGAIAWSTRPSPIRDCIEIGGGWDNEKNVCRIFSECLDKGGCYALPVPGLLPRDQPWCLFGEDITPEACYNSQALRESLGQ